MEAGAGLDPARRRQWQPLRFIESQNLGGARLQAHAESKTVYGSFTWMDGDQVFTLFNTAAWAPLYAYAKAVATDPALASAFGGAPTAYRLEARTDRYELGLNIALNGSNALDLGMEPLRFARRHGGGKYDGDTFRVGHIYRFR